MKEIRKAPLVVAGIFSAVAYYFFNRLFAIYVSADGGIVDRLLFCYSEEVPRILQRSSTIHPRRCENTKANKRKDCGSCKRISGGKAPSKQPAWRRRRVIRWHI